jgi:hypothetical protein
MTSGGKQNPAKAEWGDGAGRRRRGRIATVLPAQGRSQQLQQFPRSGGTGCAECGSTWPRRSQASAAIQGVGKRQAHLSAASTTGTIPAVRAVARNGSTSDMAAGLHASSKRHPPGQPACLSPQNARLVRESHGVSVTCSGVTGTPSLQRPMNRCSAVPPSATRHSCRRIAQSCSASSSFQGP